METILVLLALAGLCFVLVRLLAGARLMAERLEGVDSRLTHTQAANQRMAVEIFENLGRVSSATSVVAEQARQFASLQDLLKAPKARGGLGEAMLEEMLGQVLPPAGYETQHRFSSGLVVDAVVKAGGRLVCIDSKFPLANYQRICDAADEAERAAAERAFAADVDKHVRDIAERYIVPDEGTLDFAVMYVPAEGVYGEVLRLAYRGRPLWETAIECGVVPMSPLNLYGYLQTVLHGLNCLKIEKNAEAILGYCGQLKQDLERFAAEYDTLGRHLGNAYSKYQEGDRRLDGFRDRLERVVDLAGVDPSEDEEARAPRPPLEAVNE